MDKQFERENYTNQLNPHNDTYWQARGYKKQPADWKERSQEERAKDQAASRSSTVA